MSELLLKLQNRRGFSLIEVLIVIAIIAIICAVGIPYFSGFIDNRNLKTAADDITGDVNEYKGRAIAEDRLYQFVFSNPSSYQIKQCNTSNDSLCALGYTTLFTKKPAQFGSDISMNSTIGTLQFQPRGTATPNGTVTLSNVRGSNAIVTISSTGRTYVQWNMQ